MVASIFKRDAVQIRGQTIAIDRRIFRDGWVSQTIFASVKTVVVRWNAGTTEILGLAT